MGLFNQIDPASKGFDTVFTGSAAIQALRSLVVRCDTCGGDGTLFACFDHPDGGGTPDLLLGGQEASGTTHPITCHLVPCPTGCVNGWQPSDELLKATSRTIYNPSVSEIGRAVLRLLDQGGADDEE